MTKKSKVNRSKVEIVFDNNERHEFLTGFSKRKQARKKAAYDQLEKRYKEEVTRIKKEKRDRIKQRLEEVASVKSSLGSIDLAKLAQNELDKEDVIDLPQHVVTITSTEEIDLTTNKDDAFLGSNVADDIETVDNSNDVDEGFDTEAAALSAKKSSDSLKKSKAKAADLARRTQSLKAKRQKRNATNIGKVSKSQKKFLKKRKGGKHKNKCDAKAKG